MPRTKTLDFREFLFSGQFEQNGKRKFFLNVISEMNGDMSTVHFQIVFIELYFTKFEQIRNIFRQ